MRSTDQIKRYFKNAELRINQETDETVFKEVIENLPVMPESHWRMFTKSSLAKLSVAAALVIVSVTGISLWKNTGSGIALADVLNRIEQMRAYRYQMTMTVTGQYMEDFPIHLEAQLTTLVSRDYGVRITCESSPLPITGQRMNQEMYIQPSKKTITTLMPDEKAYAQTAFDDTSLEKMSSEFYDPRFIVKHFLACEHIRLGKTTLDGVEAERFRTTDPNFVDDTFSGAHVTFEIWIDVKRHLPVRLELDVNKEDKMQMQGLVYDFQWDVPVSAAQFEPVIPDDYTIGHPPMTIAPKPRSKKTVPPP